MWEGCTAIPGGGSQELGDEIDEWSCAPSRQPGSADGSQKPGDRGSRGLFLVNTAAPCPGEAVSISWVKEHPHLVTAA